MGIWNRAGIWSGSEGGNGCVKLFRRRCSRSSRSRCPGCSYNKFTTQEEAIKGSWGEVQNQIQRRNDLIPNLVESVKGFAAHEEGIFKEIADARAKLLAAKSPAETIAAANQQSSALGRLLAVVENYPNLKANEQFNRLMDELAGTENRLTRRARALQRAHPGVQHHAAQVPEQRDRQDVRLQGIPVLRGAAVVAGRAEGRFQQALVRLAICRKLLRSAGVRAERRSFDLDESNDCICASAPDWWRPVCARSACAACRRRASSSLRPPPPPIHQTDDPILKNFTWRSIGPANMGGRIDDIAVVESNPSTYYVGFATGGLWKTVNNGTTWTPLFDEQPVTSIGDVTVAPSDPNVVYVGTGEPNNRQSSSFGARRLQVH